MDISNGLVQNIFFSRLAFLGDKTAFYDYDLQRSYTFKEVNERSDRAAAFLTQKLHIQKGDRVGVCALNRIEFFDMFFACYKTGIILTTYNGKLMDWELADMIRNEDPGIVFTDRYYKDKVSALRSDFDLKCGQICFDDNGPDGYDAVLSCEDSFPVNEPEMEDILMLIHTGGTTGIPKAAKLSYRAIVFNAVTKILSHELNSSDLVYLTTPLFHTAAWNSVALAFFLAGGTVVLKRRFDVEHVFDIIDRFKPTVFISVPTIYTKIAEDPRFETTDFSSIRSMWCGASMLQMSLFEKYDRKNLPLCNSYGLTECGPSNFTFPVRLTTQEMLRKKAGFVGKPYQFNKVRVVDDEGNPVGPNTPGDLEFAGPLTFSGYWNHEEETRNVVKGEWVSTGDIALYDEDGFYKIVGRKKNMFISGGENIFSVEIENVLLTMDDIKDCGVIGVEDNYWGEVGKAYIVPREKGTLTEEAVIAFCRTKLPSIKIPKQFVFLDALPRNDSGKLLYRELEKL